MKKFADFITKKHILVLFIGLLLLVPAVIGYINTRINYDVLVYLPEDMDTIKGERILTKDFGVGSYAFVMINTKDNYKVLKLEEKVKKIKGVNKVFSEADILGTTIPKEMLPDEVLDKLYDKDTSIMMVTFKGSTSEDETINAVRD